MIYEVGSTKEQCSQRWASARRESHLAPLGDKSAVAWGLSIIASRPMFSINSGTRAQKGIMWRPRSAPKVSGVRILNYATSARNLVTSLRIASTGLFDDLIIIIKMLTQLKDEGVKD
jgi:hypothetical protein